MCNNNMTPEEIQDLIKKPEPEPIKLPKLTKNVKIPKLNKKRGKPLGFRATKPRYFVEVCDKDGNWLGVGFYPTHLAISEALGFTVHQARDIYSGRYKAHHDKVRISKLVKKK